MALYGAIFDKQPTKRVDQIADKLLQDLPPEIVLKIIDEIELELKNPCQEVKNIHDAVASEDELRRLLELILTKLGTR